MTNKIVDNIKYKDSTDLDRIVITIDYHEDNVGLSITGFFKNGFWDGFLHVHRENYHCPYCYTSYSRGNITCKSAPREEQHLLEELIKTFPYEIHKEKLSKLKYEKKEQCLQYLQYVLKDEKPPLLNFQHWFWDKKTCNEHISINIEFSFPNIKQEYKFKHRYIIEVIYYFFENRFDISDEIYIVMMTETEKQDLTEAEKETLLHYAKSIFNNHKTELLGKKIFKTIESDYKILEGEIKLTPHNLPIIDYGEEGYELLFNEKELIFSKKEAEEKLYNFIKEDYEKWYLNDEWMKMLYKTWVHYNPDEGERFQQKRRALLKIIEEKTGVKLERV